MAQDFLSGKPEEPKWDVRMEIFLKWFEQNQWRAEKQKQDWTNATATWNEGSTSVKKKTGDRAVSRSCLTLIKSVLVQWSEARMEDVVSIEIIFCKLKHVFLSLLSTSRPLSFLPPLPNVRHHWMAFYPWGSALHKQPELVESTLCIELSALSISTL